KANALAHCFQARLEVTSENLGRRPPGPAVDLVIASDPQVVKHARAPVLLVRGRPWSPERRFAACVDVADRLADPLASAILRTAGVLGLGLEAWVDVLYCEREPEHQAQRLERAVRLARLARDNHVGGERLEMLDGAPEKI